MPNEPNLGVQLQSVTVQVDGVPYEMTYGATEPEYVGRMTLRTELEILPLPPDRDSQDDLRFLDDLPPTMGQDFEGQVMVADFWNPAPDLTQLQVNPNSGVLNISGAGTNQDITFYSKDSTEVLRITDNGDFLVQGRLVRRDMDVYNAFRMFLGLSLGMPPEPGSRDGIPTRYERILKKTIEDQ
jgi:hypothetical protein